VNSRFFSVNSSFFFARFDKSPRPLPVTRLCSLVRPLESFSSLRGGFRACTRGYRGEAFSRAARLFLSRRAAAVRASGRSVAYFGIHVAPEDLSFVGLFRRECWIRESVGVEVPLPCDPGRLMWTRPPPGWERVPFARGRRARHSQRVVEKSFFGLLCDRAWQEAPSRGALLWEYRRDCRASGVQERYQEWILGGARFRRMAHRSVPHNPQTCPCLRYRVGSFPALWNRKPACGRGVGCPPGKKRVWAVKPLEEEGRVVRGSGIQEGVRDSLLSCAPRSWRPPCDLGMSLPAFQR